MKETVVDSESLSAYLTDHEGLTDGAVEVSDVVEHSEGWSRDTISFTASWDGSRSQRLVARIESEDSPVPSEALERDTEQEFRAMAAAYDIGVPVAEPYWFENDASIFGGEFFVMEHRPGEPPLTWRPDAREALYDHWDSADRSLPNQFVDALAGIHSIGPEDAPFLDHVEPEDVVDRELRGWEGVYDDVHFKDEPVVREAFRWFRQNKPDIPELRMVHGDYRIGNMLVDDDEITAVVDWEVSRLGDPLYDVGFTSSQYFAGKLIEPIERPDLVCALLDREWFYDEYEARTGIKVDMHRVRYWRAWGAFTTALIFLAGAEKYQDGRSDDVRSVWFQYPVPGLLEEVAEIIADDRI